MVEAIWAVAMSRDAEWVEVEARNLLAALIQMGLEESESEVSSVLHFKLEEPLALVGVT